jgi:hypothetical protein
MKYNEKIYLFSYLFYESNLCTISTCQIKLYLFSRCNSSGGRRVADGAFAAQRQGGQHRHRAVGHRGEQQRARRQKQGRALPLHFVPEVRTHNSISPSPIHAPFANGAFSLFIFFSRSVPCGVRAANFVSKCPEDTRAFLLTRTSVSAPLAFGGVRLLLSLLFGAVSSGKSA